MLASLFRPLLKRLLPNASRDSETLAAISANLSADLLGLGNAATPLGIRAACRMSRGCKGTASDELCLLVVLNTASIQLLPTTLAGVRASLGAADPFDILPTVWLTSLLSVLAGLFAAKLFALDPKLTPEKAKALILAGCQQAGRVNLVNHTKTIALLKPAAAK